MEWTKLKAIALLLTGFIFMVGCGADDEDGGTPDVPVLNIMVENHYETPPSRVSVFFKVENARKQPVGGLTEEDFKVFEKGRNDDTPRLLSIDEATRTLSKTEVVFDFNTMLVLDLSGSVLNGNLDQLKTAATRFIDDVLAEQLNTTTKVGIWWFDGRDVLHSLISFTEDAQALKDAIDGISPSLSTDSSTDLFGAVIKATALAENKLAESEVQGIRGAVSVILFTDGTDQAARYAKQDAYEAVEDASQNISYYAIGLGNEIDVVALNRIGKTATVFADDTDALTTKFSEIADQIYAEVNSFYLFEYCTPKRDGSGITQLTLEIDSQKGTGKRVIEFDATGFQDDCDLN